MSTATVLYDAPGPLTRRRQRIYSVVFLVVLVAVLAWVGYKLNTKGEFDVIASALVLHFIPDRGKAFAEMQRVTKAGGIVSGYTWERSATSKGAPPARARRSATTRSETSGPSDAASGERRDASTTVAWCSRTRPSRRPCHLPEGPAGSSRPRST